MAFLLLASGMSLLVGRSIACKQFDPNAADLEMRLQQGRARAVVRAEFERQLRAQG